MAGNARLPGQSVADKFAAIVRAFGHGDVHSLTQLAMSAGLATSTTHRLANEMVTHGILDRTEDGCYRAGTRLQGLGREHRFTPDLAVRGPIVVGDLAEATQLRCRLGILRELKVHYIEKVPGHLPVTGFGWGATIPVHASALGRALLAYSSRGEIELLVFQGLFPYSARTVTTPRQLRRELAIVRATGVSVVRGELESGVDAVAIPVFAGPDRPVAALELTMSARTDLSVCVAALSMASACLAAELTGSRGSGRSAAAGSVVLPSRSPAVSPLCPG